MAISTSISQPNKLSLFLNISFLFLLSLFLITNSLQSTNYNSNSLILSDKYRVDDGCINLHKYTDSESKCLYVKTQKGCRPDGFINYLQIFYCNFGQFPFLGHASILLWLLVLFYLLGNTASNFFCSSLESLSKLLKLSPTIAGVTLLSLGNGAPDVFSSVVSFTSSGGDGDVGLNSVLGGAFFVSSIVVGVIGIVISPQQISVDEGSFKRDVLFFLVSLSSLLVIIVIGRINLWGAIAFVAIYFVYVGTVSATQLYKSKERKRDTFGKIVDLEDATTTTTPLLGYLDDDEKAGLGLVDQDQNHGLLDHDHLLPSHARFYLGKLVYLLELPLSLPRRLTIPVVSEEGWSKPFAVISVTLAPLLLAVLCNSLGEIGGLRSRLVTYLTAGLIGIIFGNLAYVTTKRCGPPTKCLFPWLVGGFLMSVAWTYITAEELVSLLVSYGNILGISPSILGLTVLAWGNSLGDLIANVAMAINGGPDGAQIAFTGCYAGPMFNTLVGVGLPLILSTWSEYPASYVIPTDHSLYETLGFLMGGLLWALVILPRKNMKPDRYMGSGLLAIYLCFLFMRLARLLVTGL